MEKQKAKEGGRNAKKTTRQRRNGSCESDGNSEANCDTKSYRIYGNPKGDGFAIEERFRRAGEDCKHDGEMGLGGVKTNDYKLFERNKEEKSKRASEMQNAAKIKKRS